MATVIRVSNADNWIAIAVVDELLPGVGFRRSNIIITVTTVAATEAFKTLTKPLAPMIMSLNNCTVIVILSS